MEIKKLKIITVVVVLLAISFAPFAKAGISGKSPYDLIVDIYVTTCDGNKMIFRECVITDIGPWSVSFIADQGRMPTGNGKEIIVNKNSCTSVIMIEKYSR